MTFTNDPALLVNQLPISLEFPKDFEKFLEIWTLLYKRIANATNTKEGALYTLQELINFQQYFSPGNPQVFRNVYRKTFSIGPVAPSATVVVPHGIVGILESAGIYAHCTSNVPEFFTVVYPDIKLDTVNITFTNPTTDTLDPVYVVAEYLKTA